MYRRHFLTAAMILVRAMTRPAAEAARQLTISWEKNYLTIRGDFPGNEISILYLEAYCRPGSVDREGEERWPSTGDCPCGTGTTLEVTAASAADHGTETSVVEVAAENATGARSATLVTSSRRISTSRADASVGLSASATASTRSTAPRAACSGRLARFGLWRRATSTNCPTMSATLVGASDIWKTRESATSH
jgi:hypothetical protein